MTAIVLAILLAVGCGADEESPAEHPSSPEHPTTPTEDPTESTPTPTPSSDSAGACQTGSCEARECLRAYTCVRACGDEATMCGCCACSPGWLDALVACPREQATPRAPSGDDGDIDCASDDECRVLLRACDCACYARHTGAPFLTDAQMSARCGGAPPRNCGAQSPCAERRATCDAATHRCTVVE